MRPRRPGGGFGGRHRVVLESRSHHGWPPQARPRRSRHPRHRRRLPDGHAGRDGPGRGVLRRHRRLRRSRHQLLPRRPAVLHRVVRHLALHARHRGRRRAPPPVLPESRAVRAESRHDQGVPDGIGPLSHRRRRRRYPALQRPGHGPPEPGHGLRRRAAPPARPGRGGHVHGDGTDADVLRHRRGHEPALSRDPGLDGRARLDHGQRVPQRPRPDRAHRRRHLSRQHSRAPLCRRRSGRLPEQRGERVPALRDQRQLHRDHRRGEHQFRRGARSGSALVRLRAQS